MLEITHKLFIVELLGTIAGISLAELLTQQLIVLPVHVMAGQETTIVLQVKQKFEKRIANMHKKYRRQEGSQMAGSYIQWLGDAVTSL